RAAGGLNEHARGWMDQLQDEIARHAKAARESASNAAIEAEQRLTALRDSLQEQTQRLESVLAVAAETGQRLEQHSAQLENAQQHRIRNTADEAFAESLARFRENLGSVEQILQDSSQSITYRNLTELEGKAGDLKHQVVEELHKSAEWYEKKAQTQIQNLTERAVEHAENRLRERAG